MMVMMVMMNIGVFFFQSFKPQTGLKTPAKQNGTNIKRKLREEKRKTNQFFLNERM